MVNGHTLQRWNKGDQLSADMLNGNFLMLYEMVIDALAASKLPDPANVALEMKTASMIARVEALEKLTAMHAHQRNEKQYVPLSYHAAVIIMVNDLRRDVEHAINRADQMHTTLGVDLDDLQRRLMCLEQIPDAASKEAFALVARDHERVSLEFKAALAEIVELRHEVSVLRDWMLGTDQRTNRVQYAPLGMVGQLLQRIEALEAKQC